MKALQVVKPGEVRMVDVPPPQPKADEVLLKVRRIGFCGSDLNTFRGKNPLVSYPRILGHEIAATVEAGPQSGDGIAVGTNVAVSPLTGCGKCAACRRERPNACEFNETFGVQRDGALAEFIAVRPEKIYQAHGLSLDELALVEPLTVGFHAAARGRVAESDTVAVFGCGGVGLGAIAGAARRGARVIGVDIDDAKLALAQAAGAKLTIHSEREALHERLAELTNGGPDVVIEAIGLPATFRAAVEEVAYTGRVVYIGWSKEPVTYETRLFILKELEILGSRNALPEDFRAVIEMLQQGGFPVRRAISKIVPLAEAAAALAEWSANPSGFSKILVRVDE
ncbi:MAG: zinc-binding alcohol dehydrogenase family protein [Acidobacteriota bacterium]|nr:zinc-binding alcohol dehydrogenase family protein [Acidobacteriota bacterium]